MNLLEKFRKHYFVFNKPVTIRDIEKVLNHLSQDLNQG